VYWPRYFSCNIHNGTKRGQRKFTLNEAVWPWMSSRVETCDCIFKRVLKDWICWQLIGNSAVSRTRVNKSPLNPALSFKIYLDPTKLESSTVKIHSGTLCTALIWTTQGKTYSDYVKLTDRWFQMFLIMGWDRLSAEAGIGFCHSVQTDSRVHSGGSSFAGNKWPKHESDHKSATNVYVNNIAACRLIARRWPENRQLCNSRC
jgi:hypothetical protein